MAADSFAENSAGWQIQELQQRFTEWAELQLVNNPPDIPTGSLPPLPGWLAEFLVVLVVGMCGIVLSWLVLRAFLPDLQRWLSQNRPLTQSPVSVPKTPGAAVWLRRSQQWQQQGNYREACRALYMAMLERLHETQQVPHKESRTDGEYRACVQPLPKPKSYQLLINVHEQLCFGDATISAEVFQRCQKAYQATENS
ncbi:DUF4129 domain-containing protein [bacterium]|nr:DUF4129 domain-containing protein [bacterium]